MKVLSQNVVHGCFAVTVDVYNHDKKNNDILVDNHGRKFKIKSVAMTNSHNDTTFVLHPLDGTMSIGEYVQ